MSIELLVREWRKHRGMTQEVLGEILGVSHSTIQKIETGKYPPTTAQLAEIAKALDCSVVDLLLCNPADSADIWCVWNSIPEIEKPKALKVLRAFAGHLEASSGEPGCLD